jgi:hypothetical protein
VTLPDEPIPAPPPQPGPPQPGPPQPGPPQLASPQPGPPQPGPPPLRAIAASPAPVPQPMAPGSRFVALLLAAAALTAAILAARASFLSNDATGLWQQSLREEVKSGAAVVETIRFLYDDEARATFRYAIAKIREEEFRKAADGRTGPTRDALLFEAEVQAQVVPILRSSWELANDPRYARPDGGYDVLLRLADSRAQDPDLVALDPDARQTQGDRPAAKAVATMAATLPVGIAFLLGAFAQAFIRWRRLLLAFGAGSLVGAMILAVAVEYAL